MDESTTFDEAVFVSEDFEVLEILPHDPTAFTQGLTYHNEKLYESTGLYGQSQLRQLGVRSGLIMDTYNLDPQYFGEGITIFSNANQETCLLQLTWKEQTAFLYHTDNNNSIKIMSQFQLDVNSTTTGEGWGVTYNNRTQEFIVSDGSAFLHFWDRDTFRLKRKVLVVYNNRPIRLLNELEYSQQENVVFANVWYQDVLLRIDPQTGQVLKVYDFSTLYTNRTVTADVFNGIAAFDNKNVFLVTGKFWPFLYKVRLLP